MPRSRTNARRRPMPRISNREAGQFVWMGPLTHDAVDYTRLPKVLCVRQRAGLVSSRWSDGTRDWVDPVDHRVHPAAAPTLPTALYHCQGSNGHVLLTTSAAERDAFAGRWRIEGYVYTGGDEESGLSITYRDYYAATDDTLITPGYAEHVQALDVFGYTAVSNSFYVFTAARGNRKAVHRSFNSNESAHVYTTQFAEIEALSSTWGYEGVVFYILGGEEGTVS